VAPTGSSIEYDGRWKILHYTAKDVYELVIIAPHFNISTGDLSIWVTSDPWESVSASAAFEWYDWSGGKLDVNTTPAVNFAVGAINSTQIPQTSTKEVLGGIHDPRNTILKTSVRASG
jgi:beta-mannosidase